MESWHSQHQLLEAHEVREHLGDRAEQRAGNRCRRLRRPCRARARAATFSTIGTPCSRATSRMRAAIRSWPLATTHRRRPSRRGWYSSATAKWVGLVMTTVAFGTACEHAAARHLALHPADARLDLGVAFAASSLRRGLPAASSSGDCMQPPAAAAVVGAARSATKREARLPEQRRTDSQPSARRPAPASPAPDAALSLQHRAARARRRSTPTTRSPISSVLTQVERRLRRREPLEAG